MTYRKLDLSVDENFEKNRARKKRDFSYEIDEEEREWRRKEIEGYLTVDEIRALGFHAKSFRSLLEEEELPEEGDLSDEDKAEWEKAMNNPSEDIEYKDDDDDDDDDEEEDDDWDETYKDDEEQIESNDNAEEVDEEDSQEIVAKCMSGEIKQISLSRLPEGTIIKRFMPYEQNPDYGEKRRSLLTQRELKGYTDNRIPLLYITRSKNNRNANTDIPVPDKVAKICGLKEGSIVCCTTVLAVKEDTIIPGNMVKGTLFKSGASDFLFKVMRTFNDIKEKDMTFLGKEQPNPVEESIDYNTDVFVVMRF